MKDLAYLFDLLANNPQTMNVFLLGIAIGAMAGIVVSAVMWNRTTKRVEEEADALFEDLQQRDQQVFMLEMANRNLREHNAYLAGLTGLNGFAQSPEASDQITQAELEDFYKELTDADEDDEDPADAWKRDIQIDSCSSCGTTKSPGWYRLHDGRTLCDQCGDNQLHKRDIQFPNPKGNN